MRAAERCPWPTAAELANDLGDPRDHSRSLGSAPCLQPRWLPPGRNDARLGAGGHQPTQPSRPQSARGRRPESAGGRRLTPAATDPMEAAVSDCMGLGSLTPVELQELVWRLRLENDQLRRRQGTVGDATERQLAAHSVQRREFSEAKTQLADERKRVADLETSNRELFSENGRLLERLQGLEQQAEEAKQEREQLKDELHVAREKLEELEDEHDATRSKRDLIARQLAEAEQQLCAERRENQRIRRAEVEAEIQRALQAPEEKRARGPRYRRKIGASDACPRGRVIRNKFTYQGIPSKVDSGLRPS